MFDVNEWILPCKAVLKGASAVCLEWLSTFQQAMFVCVRTIRLCLQCNNAGLIYVNINYVQYLNKESSIYTTLVFIMPCQIFPISNMNVFLYSRNKTVLSIQIHVYIYRSLFFKRYSVSSGFPYLYFNFIILLYSCEFCLVGNRDPPQ